MRDSGLVLFASGLKRSSWTKSGQSHAIAFCPSMWWVPMCLSQQGDIPGLLQLPPRLGGGLLAGLLPPARL